MAVCYPLPASCSHLPRASLTTRRAQARSGLHRHTFRVCRAHRLTLGPWLSITTLHFHFQPPQPAEEAGTSWLPWWPKDESLGGSNPPFPPPRGSLSGQTEATRRVTSLSQISSPIICAFLTFSVLLGRLNPYLLQAIKKGSSITIQKPHNQSNALRLDFYIKSTKEN